MNRMIRLLTMLCLMVALPMQAANYTTLLTPAKGFTEVTSASALVATPDIYYILASAEDTGLLVGIGDYELKPGWASEQTKALRYVPADATAVMTPANFFTIEKDGTVRSSDFVRTGNAVMDRSVEDLLSRLKAVAPPPQAQAMTFEVTLRVR